MSDKNEVKGRTNLLRVSVIRGGEEEEHPGWGKRQAGARTGPCKGRMEED